MTERIIGKDENLQEALKAFQAANKCQSIIVVSDSKKGTRMIASDTQLVESGEDARRLQL